MASPERKPNTIEDSNFPVQLPKSTEALFKTAEGPGTTIPDTDKSPADYAYPVSVKI